MTIFDQIKRMFDQHLYSNVVSLASLSLSINDHNADFMSAQERCQILVYVADSSYHLKEYRKAESIYRKALQMKKALIKNRVKGPTTIPASGILISDIDVKYQIYLCHIELKQFPQAIAVLETIPGKQRTSKVNMALAKLYHQSGMERSAVTGYREVLKECPLALDAALGLLALGVKGAEVASFMLNSTASMTNMEWLSTWIKAHAHLYSKEFGPATATFKQLDGKSFLRDNVGVLVSLGESHFYSGDFTQSAAALQRARAIDPFVLRGMDILASLLMKEKKIQDLESLAIGLMNTTEVAAEPWVAMAYLVFSTKSVSKAIYYAQKACAINPRSVEAHILKGTFLLEMKKLVDAVSNFREALKISPHRFEAHKGLANCYIALGRVRDAISIASGACKLIGQNPRTLTLYGSMLAKDPLSYQKAETILEKALKLDSTNLEAIFQLAEIYEQDHRYEKGIELLSKQVKIQNSCRLHQVLAEFYRRNNEHDKALEHFSASLSLDGANRRALEGIQRLEQHPDNLASEDGEVEDTPEIDEVDLEGSEVEAVWSDMDFT